MKLLMDASVYLDDLVPVVGEVEEVGAYSLEATREERLAVVAQLVLVASRVLLRLVATLVIDDDCFHSLLIVHDTVGTLYASLSCLATSVLCKLDDAPLVDYLPPVIPLVVLSYLRGCEGLL